MQMEIAVAQESHLKHFLKYLVPPVKCKIINNNNK